jgi:hypothetical protein
MSDKKLYGMAENNTWNSAVTMARNENPNVNMGFARKGTPLYARAKEIQAGMSKSMGGGSPMKTKTVAPKPKQQPLPLPLQSVMYEDDSRSGGSAKTKGFKVRFGGGVGEQSAPKMISVSSFRDYFAQRK